MRTTLTLDDDVAAEIERLRRDRHVNLKDVVNDALRRGLRDMRAPQKRRVPFRLEPIDVGEPRIASFDNVAEVVALAEGEDHR